MRRPLQLAATTVALLLASCASVDYRGALRGLTPLETPHDPRLDEARSNLLEALESPLISDHEHEPNYLDALRRLEPLAD